jgi:LPS-assembly protein
MVFFADSTRLAASCRGTLASVPLPRSHPAVLCTLILLVSGPVLAQEIPGLKASRQLRIERIGTDHWRLTGNVEVEGENQTFYADEVEVFTQTHRILGRGNVVFTTAGHRIAADRMDFDYQTRTGVFDNASGSASLGDRVERSMFGTQEPDAYFYGERIEKLGPTKYRITKGGFTTCVQPTPRWELTSGSVTINLDEYAILRNSLLKVKGVPVLYMPIFYYPIQEDDRATGFLLPTYGTSTVRGQTLSNAFFWAINRSSDATLFHDWFSKTGQGTGGELRYVLGPGSDGSFRTYLLNERQTSYEAAAGDDPIVVPGRRSYEIRAGVNQVLPGRIRARGRIDYFSNVTVQQIYHQNIYDATQRSRSVGANVTGNWAGIGVNGSFDRRETFFGETNSTLYGGAPRISVNRAARQIGSSPIYYSAGGEYVNLLYQGRVDDRVVTDRGLWRVDFAPTLRAPLSRWQFLTINSSVTWRNTYYSESLQNGAQAPVGLWRRYFDLRSDVVGPVFTRVWNTPDNGYAEKFKHVIEPHVGFQRVTSIDNRDQIVLLHDGGDYVVGGVTRVTYGLTNRFLARTRSGGPRARSREFLTVSLNQSYYTDERASQFDQSYSTSFRGRPPSNFSPVSLGVRATPSDNVNAGLRLEYDPEIGAIQSINANGSVIVTDLVTATAGWSQRRLTLDALNPDLYQLDNFINAAASLRTRTNRVGGTYAFNYDIGRSTLLQQRLVGYYNAQCCGFAVEYQAFNFPRFDRFRVPQDRRFNFSFTLAGIGTFSNIFGALAGTPR